MSRWFPRWFRATIARLALAALLALGGSLTAGSATAALDVESAEAQLLDLLNADRIAHGLQPLLPDPRLMEVARWRSEDMVARNYLSHDIGGYTIARILHQRGIPFVLAGENLASSTYGDVNAVALTQADLMDSPTHRANILRPEFTLVGIGVAVASNGRTIFTQIFSQA